MADKKFIDNNGLAHLWLLLKEKLVRKELKTGSSTEYKVLSDNNLTDELVTKINNAGSSSFSGSYNDLTDKPDLTTYENDIESIKVNGTAQTITNKAVDITVPTNNNQLTNGAGYQTASQVSSAISSAIAGVTQFDYSIVSSLPSTGTKGTIYLVSNSGTGTNIYDEYIYVNSAFEKIGTTEVNLSGYVKEENLVAITNAEIDEIFAE